MKNKVLVLLSTYNGEKYLSELLESLLHQKENVDILIRDDGSNDRTIDILKTYEHYKNIKIVYEKNVGYAKSFWNLIKKADEYDYYAFCDQDDIWEEDKITSAIDFINQNKEKNIPILYTSRVKAINNNLKIINDNLFECNHVINKYESFQKSVVPGCTFVFNNNAIKYLKKYDGYMESHDWATYAIINVFGKVLYDENSYIKYRLHDENTIGKEKKSTILKKRIKRFFRKSKHTRSMFAKDFYDCFENDLNELDKEQIYQLGYYRKKIKSKIKLLFNKNFKGFIFKVYVLLNRV